MASYEPKKWWMRKVGPQGYRELQELSENVNSSSIGVPIQKLWLPKVELPFMDSSNFALTSNVTFRAFCFGSGCQLAHSRMYS